MGNKDSSEEKDEKMIRNDEDVKDSKSSEKDLSQKKENEVLNKTELEDKQEKKDSSIEKDEKVNRNYEDKKDILILNEENNKTLDDRDKDSTSTDKDLSPKKENDFS